MNRVFLFLNLLALSASSVGQSIHRPAPKSPSFPLQLSSSPPNIVVILADDLGYGDLSCYGSTEIATPNIDAMAASGARLSNAYVTAPLCGPSRAGLLTGRSQSEFGFEYNLSLEMMMNNKWGLPADQYTIAERLKDIGYHTGMVGKWHLGWQPQFRPNKNGFESFFGFLEGGSGYFPDSMTPVNKMRTIYRNNEPVIVNQYLTDEFTDQAVSYIRERARQPGSFFLYVAYNAPHTPFQATPNYKKRFPNLTGDRQTYAAMISAMDDGVGRIRHALINAGIADHTMVIFLSDNGGVVNHGAASNAPWRGWKTSVWEGGIRVPFIISYPERIAPNTTYDGLISSMDILPTSVDIAGGICGPDVTGRSFLHAITTDDTSIHRTLYWKFGERKAARVGDWKLVKREAQFPWMLRNLETDPRENKDLASKDSTIFDEMMLDYDAWEHSLPPAMWPKNGIFPTD